MGGRFIVTIQVYCLSIIINCLQSSSSKCHSLWQSTLIYDNENSLMTINTHWWQSTLFDDNQNLLMTINIYWWWSTLIDDDHYSLMTIKCCYQSINYHLWELLSVYSLILINNESIKMKSSLSFSYHFFVDTLPELFQCSMNKKMNGENVCFI